MSTEHNNPYQPPKVFGRFSDDIRAAMKLANREAKRHFAASIETFHILTAIVQEPTGLGGALLRHYGASGSLVRKHSQHLRVGPQWVTVWGNLPLSKNAQQSIDTAINQATIENHDSVGTGGLLLAMVTTDETTNSLLRVLGIDVHRFEQDLTRYLKRFMIDFPGQDLQIDPLD